MTNTTGIIQTLRAVARDTSKLLGEQLRPLGLTVPQAEFLAALATNPHYSGADAAKACHLTPQTGTTLLQNLTAQHLIELSSPPGTGRRHTITVTPAGHEVLAKAQTVIADVENTLAARLGVIACRKLQTIHDTPTAGPSKRPPAAARPKGAGVGTYTAHVHDNCRAWAAATDTPNFVPGHIAHAYGTDIQVDQLVTAGAWTPDGDGYRIS